MQWSLVQKSVENLFCFREAENSRISLLGHLPFPSPLGQYLFKNVFTGLHQLCPLFDQLIRATTALGSDIARNGKDFSPLL